MTDADAKRIMAYSAQADKLAQLRAKKCLSQNEYIDRLNKLRAKCGLPPIEDKG